VVREDAHTLYGFATLEERSALHQLIRISSVGARTALAVLSGLSVGELARVVTLQALGEGLGLFLRRCSVTLLSCNKRRLGLRPFCEKSTVICANLVGSVRVRGHQPTTGREFR
jgi:hypothetical protein